MVALPTYSCTSQAVGMQHQHTCQYSCWHTCQQPASFRVRGLVCPPGGWILYGHESQRHVASARSVAGCRNASLPCPACRLLCCSSSMWTCTHQCHCQLHGCMALVGSQQPCTSVHMCTPSCGASIGAAFSSLCTIAVGQVLQHQAPLGLMHQWAWRTHMKFHSRCGRGVNNSTHMPWADWPATPATRWCVLVACTCMWNDWGTVGYSRVAGKTSGRRGKAHVTEMVMCVARGLATAALAPAALGSLGGTACACWQGCCRGPQVALLLWCVLRLLLLLQQPDTLLTAWWSDTRGCGAPATKRMSASRILCCVGICLSVKGSKGVWIPFRLSQTPHWKPTRVRRLQCCMSGGVDAGVGGLAPDRLLDPTDCWFHRRTCRALITWPVMVLVHICCTCIPGTLGRGTGSHIFLSLTVGSHQVVRRPAGCLLLHTTLPLD